MKKTLLAAALLVGLAQGHPIEAPSAWAPAPVCAIGSVSYLDKAPLPDWLANAQTLAPDWLQLRDLTAPRPSGRWWPYSTTGKPPVPLRNSCTCCWTRRPPPPAS